jgi:hypothetical protein
MSGFFRTLYDMFRILCSLQNDKQQLWHFWHFLAFFDKFGLFGQFWLFLAFLEIFGFHVAFIGGTYRAQKLDLDDNVEGTKKAM